MNHLVRAEHMPPVLARAYLRHLARGTLRYARYERAQARRTENYSVRMRAEEETHSGIIYANACRQYPGGPVSLTDWDFSERYHRRVTNPHWPNLSSYGVYVSLYEYHGSKPKQWQIEVQILPHDYEQTQCCSVRNFVDRNAAIRYGQKWITVGEAVIQAQEKLNETARV